MEQQNIVININNSRNGERDGLRTTGNSSGDGNTANATTEQSCKEDVEVFLRNVQVMLLNFFTEGIPIQDVLKHYRTIFTGEVVPNFKASGFAGCADLLLSEYAKAFVVVLFYKKGNSKPNLIKGKHLSTRSHLMIKKGRDIVRIVRRSTGHHHRRSDDNINISSNKQMPEDRSASDVITSSNLTRDRGTSLEGTIGSVENVGQRSNKKETAEVYNGAGARFASTCGDGRKVNEPKLSGGVKIMPKVVANQYLSKDLPEREFVLECADQFPPDVILRRPQSGQSSFPHPKPTFPEAALKRNQHERSREENDNMFAAAPNDQQPPYQPHLMSAGEFDAMFTRRPRKTM